MMRFFLTGILFFCFHFSEALAAVNLQATTNEMQLSLIDYSSSGAKRFIHTATSFSFEAFTKNISKHIPYFELKGQNRCNNIKETSEVTAISVIDEMKCSTAQDSARKQPVTINLSFL